MKQWAFLFRSSGRGDWRAAQPFLGEARKDRRVSVRDAKSKVTRMLQENWDWVLAVSNELRKKRVLTGDEIKNLAIPG